MGRIGLRRAEARHRRQTLRRQILRKQERLARPIGLRRRISRGADKPAALDPSACVILRRFVEPGESACAKSFAGADRRSAAAPATAAPGPGDSPGGGPGGDLPGDNPGGALPGDTPVRRGLRTADRIADSCRTGRPRGRRDPAAPAEAVAAEFGEGIVLADQPREFRQRVVGRRRGLGAAAIGSLDRKRAVLSSAITNPIPVLGGHPDPMAGTVPALWSAPTGSPADRAQSAPSYRISPGASTPNSFNPEARTVTTPWTSARRATVSSGSSRIMKRK